MFTKRPELMRWPLSMAALLLSASLCAQTPTPIPRTPEGKPDFSGVWQTGGISLTGTQANVVPDAAASATAAPMGGRNTAKPTGPWADLPTQPPLQPWAAEKVKGLTAKDDPTVRCFMPGVPRAFSQPFPFEIVQTPQKVVILYEVFHSFRIIPIDGRKPVGEVLPGYMGDSTGHWEGDTLVVVAENFNGRIWGPGNMRVTSDAFRVTERYTQQGDTIAYEAKIEDPNVLTGPFVQRLTMRRPPETRVAEYECLEGNDDVPHLVGP
jgi:hypothetical protein